MMLSFVHSRVKPLSVPVSTRMLLAQENLAVNSLAKATNLFWGEFRDGLSQGKSGM